MKKVTDERIETRIRSLELSGDRLSLREELELSCLRELLGWRAGAEAQEPVASDAATAIRACLAEFPESVHDIVEECAAIAENAGRVAPPAQPVQVPDEIPAGLAGTIISLCAYNVRDKELAQKIWNACRDAILATQQPVQEITVDVDEVKYPRAYVECLVFEITALRKLVAEQDQRLVSYAAVATKNAADQRPVAWVPGTQLDLLRKGRVIVEADLSSVQRFDEVPLFTQPAQYPDDRDFFAWVNSDVDLSITLDDETYRGIAKAAWAGCIAAMRKKAGAA